MSKRLALIIGSSLYRDDTLSRLISPDSDVGALADILLDPEMGGFDDVKLLVNMVSYSVRKEISEFFSRKARTDLLLFYFSGHGVLDDRGQLYLAVKDTDTRVLRGTGIPARFITEEMDNSYSQRQVLILDCCHSGAFARGTKGKPGASVGTATTFEGTGFGRVVLTASDATQYAWEGNQVVGEAENSLFTHYIIEGIQSGKADANQDGRITVDELYDYAYTQILRQTPKQTPGKWSFKEQGELIIAKTPHTAMIPEPPPKRRYLGEEQEQQLEKLYTDGLSAYWLEQWDLACQKLEAILAIKPGYQDVEIKLEEVSRRKKQEELYQQAMSKYETRELAESISLLEELTAQVPDYQDADQKLERIREEKLLSDLYAEAQQMFNSGKYEAVVKIYERIQVLSPDFIDHIGLLEKSKQEVKAIERSRKLEDLYRTAILELDSGKLKESKQLFTQIQEEEEDFRDVGKLLDRVDALIVKEAEIALEAQKAEKEKNHVGTKKFWQRLTNIPTYAKLVALIIVILGLVYGGYQLFITSEPLSGNLVLWHALNDDETNGLAAVIKVFEEEHPDVEIELVQFSREEILSEFESRALEDEGPDLVIGDINWGPQWYIPGFIVEVDDIRVSNINQIAMSQGQYSGAQIGLPYSFEGVIMFRNQGIIEEPSQSFSELKEKATIATSGEIYGALIETGFYYSVPHLYALGGILLTPEGYPAFNTAEGVAWLEMLQQFIALGADDTYMDHDKELFIEGKVGVIIDGTWSIQEIANRIGENLVIDPWPEDMSGFITPMMIFLSSNCPEENQKASKAFMAFLLSKETQTLLGYYDLAHIPVNKKVKSTDGLMQQAQVALEGGTPSIIAPEMEVYWEYLPDAISLGLNGHLNLDITLDRAEGIINSILAKTQGE